MSAEAMSKDYTHLAQQGEKIGWEIRSYNANESVIEYNGKQVLLVEVDADNCTFCDGSYAHNLSGANVEGHITKWKYRENDQGRSVSEIEPIREKSEKQAIALLLRSKYAGSQLNFL